MKQILARVCDIVAIAVGALYAAHVVFRDTEALIALRLMYCVVIFAGVLLVFPVAGVYRSWRSRPLIGLYIRVLLAWCVVQTCGALLLVAVHGASTISNDWIALWSVVTAALLVLGRAMAYGCLRRLRFFGLDQTRITIAGQGHHFEEVVHKVRLHNRSGYAISDVVTFNAPDSGAASWADDECKLASLIPAVEAGLVDEVWIALPVTAQSFAMRIIEVLRRTPVRVRYLPDVHALGLRDFGGPLEMIGVPSISMSSRGYSSDGLIDKELFDRLFSAFALLALSPLLIAIAAAIKLSSPGPVFFRQQRKGLNGRKFSIYKFRSMYLHDTRHGVIRQATRNDSRITTVGRFLRRTSLDELPQFINVLRGEMSVVGPRPHALEHDAFYEPQIDDYIQRYRAKPGITGWAQVNGFRGETDQLEKMASRVEYDLYYLNNRSFALDIQIVLRTMVHGFVSKQAY
ncbi:UDP-glucose:undecaprenyl-phosphate glucose-1-phosphate transferase [Paraburkholderia tropica]|uniref:undecaprenyl-phosphate glucose phosphotransferase n=1 Tax=Paraburkholderia tropica TaxID=92647 RepID=UPI001CAC297A|nr:undecaprenyl-phosphate glucose phosphotransferase [Paraburkholderia tropica]CAG9238484.1 UDP-glucose:undecaprenyl-phosphate glucose-1-phosphate transferase [Paraburkholderia tropica]